MLRGWGCRRRCLRRRRLILLAFRGLTRRPSVIVIGISVSPPGPGRGFRALPFVRRRCGDCHGSGWRHRRSGGRGGGGGGGRGGGGGGGGEPPAGPARDAARRPWT